MSSVELRKNDIKLTLDNEVIFIKRYPRKELSAFFNLYESLLEFYLKHSTAIGAFLIDEQAYSLLTQIAKMLPIEGSDQGLDITKIEENYEILQKLFFTTSVDEETGVCDVFYKSETGMMPSYLASLNGFDFLTRIGMISQKEQIRRMTAVQTELEQMQKNEKELMETATQNKTKRSKAAQS